MIAELRKKFNSTFTEQNYNSFISDLNTSVKYPLDFRVAETPIFLSDDFVKELIKADTDILAQITSQDYLLKSARSIPPFLKVPGETTHPEFLQLDFAVTLSPDGTYLPQLIELQGFPSVYAYQHLYTDKLQKYFNIPDGFTPYFNGLDAHKYVELFRNIVLNGIPKQHVILMEIEPEKQKTRIDFAATEALTGIKTVSVSSIHKTGQTLYYYNEGKQTKIKRIYNRVIFDELLRKNIKTNFSFNDNLDVQWACHPHWFFKFSKFTLPFIHSPYSPSCHFLDQLDQVPEDLQNYVLKPLYSFAGLGVDVDVTKEKLQSITQPADYILQQKVNYAPLIQTPDGFSKVEIRMMYIWKDKPLLVNNLVRMSKGKMMGVDFNKDHSWVGSSAALHFDPK